VLPDVPVTGTDERLQLGHNSPVLVADPDDPSFVALAHRLDNPEFNCALQVSGDGGRSWLPVRPVPELPPGTDRCYAPELAFDREGVLHYLFIGLQGLGNSPSGAFLVTSRDRGRTFTPPRQMLGPERYMVRMAIDRTRDSPGRLHLVWLETSSDPPLGGLPPTPNPILSAWSDDGGKTFSSPVQVSDRARPRVVAPALTLGRDGAVHVLYYDLEDDVRDYQGLEGPPWEGTWSLILSSSTDGGRSFAPGVVVDADVVPFERVMLIYTMPPAALVADRDRVFVSWSDARSSDPDVWLRRSRDGGRTWEPPQRLNDDPPTAVSGGPPGGPRTQYLPRLAVSSDGRLDALFYDRRNDPADVRNDVLLTSSSDGGRTFSANLRLNSESFSSQIGTRYPIPSARGLVEFGSRLALLAEPSRTLAAWTDTRNQDVDAFGQDVFATEVERGGEEDDGSSAGWLVVAGAAVALGLVAGVVVVAARRRRVRAPSGDAEL
jgi:hypothetical protein